jgi:hypothetical protein
LQAGAPAQKKKVREGAPAKKKSQGIIKKKSGIITTQALLISQPCEKEPLHRKNL